jgi:hypothetical protein
MSKFNFTYNPNEFSNLRNQHDDSQSISMERDQGATTGDDSDALPPPTSVAAVKSAMSNTRLAAYLADFDREVYDDSRVVCSVPAAHVDDTARAQLLAGGVEKEDDEMHHQNELDHIDFLKRNRIMELEVKRQERRDGQRSALHDIESMRQQTSELVDTYYDQAHNELEIHLTSRQGEISQSIGEIRKFRRGDYDPDKPDWTQFEQQVQIKVVEIRGVKDKVPDGDYIVLVSKWDKLAGDPLRWSTRKVTDRPPPPCPLHGELRDMDIRKKCEICKGWAGATPPKHHNGDPRAYDLKFDSKIFTFFQSQHRIKPYNALMFELVKLPDKTRRANFHETEDAFRPQVVGWGVMPIVNSRFDVVNGKFRFPMLRGPFKPLFGHYATVQEWLVEDLENWLGNIYVEVVPSPREHYGRNEFQLQRDFSNKLLDLTNYQSSREEDGWPYDKRKRGASTDLTNNPNSKMQIMGGAVALGEEFTFEEEFPFQRPDHVPQMENDALTRWEMLRLAIVDRQRKKRLEEQAAQKEAIKREERSKAFRYSIHPYGSTNLESTWRIQVEYCMRAIKDELNLRDPVSLKFYYVVFVFFVSLYAQLYVHGIFVWFALRATSTPVDSVDPEWYGLHVHYIHRQTTQLQELFVVFFSMISLYFFLLAEVAVGWTFKKISGTIPEQLSTFVFTTSLSAIVVPVVEIILDGILDQRRSDWFRLWTFFSEHGYGQYFTIITFVLVYCFMIAGCVVSTFLYTMALHLNGILQDSYWRIMIVNEETCHIPDDLEVSIPELRHIIRKAEQWRGKNGERRKCSVHKLRTIHREEDDDDDEDGQREIIKAQHTDADFDSSDSDEDGETREQREKREFEELHGSDVDMSSHHSGFLAFLSGRKSKKYRRTDIHVQICQLNCGSAEHWTVRQDFITYREFMIEQNGAIIEMVGDRQPHGITFTLNTIAKKMKLGGGDAAANLLAMFGGGAKKDPLHDDDDAPLGDSTSPNFGARERKVRF